MHSNIVKIKNKNENKYGTGIVISESEILTAEHVVTGEGKISVLWNNIAYEGIKKQFDDYVAIIEIDDANFSAEYRDYSDGLTFTSEEVLDDTIKWYVEGYITSELAEHEMVGIGICNNKTIAKTCDCSLRRIESGTTNNYTGMSGAPVICNDRIVGIVQIQHSDVSGVLGIGFTSTQLFEQILPGQIVQETKFVNELKHACENECVCEVDKNKKSSKYIPEIFVEESVYKDNLRYFADPMLFVNKMIEELKELNFTNINDILKMEQPSRKIDFSEYPMCIKKENLTNTVELLCHDLSNAIHCFERLDNDRRSEGTSLEEWYTERTAFNSMMKWELKDALEQTKFLSYRMLLLTRNAGQGKTNFLCDFTENFLLKKKIISLYFNASEFCEKPVLTIKRKLAVNGQYDESYVNNALKKYWENTGKPIVIVIDGLNENTTLRNFERYIKESLAELMQLPYIKIIMSTRNELLDERFGLLNSKELGREFFHLDMDYRENNFANRIFNGYLDFFDVGILRETMWDGIYGLLSSDTLLLRFFCEVNRGKKQVYMYDVYKYSLFTEYYNKKKSEMRERNIAGGDIIFDNLVNHICQCMIDRRSFSHIPKDKLSNTEIQVLDTILESDVIFKEDQEIKKGFTNEYTEVLSFTFDEFRDYCLTRYLITRDDAKESFPQIWKTMCDENWAVLEGVEKYIFFLARTECPDILPIIKANSNYWHIYWNNVWNLEERDLDTEDISRWKLQYNSEGPYRTQITHHLLTRRDRDYFKKVSVDLLFNIFDEIAFELGKFDNLVRMLFPVKKLDKYKMQIEQKGKVLNCDSLIEAVNKAIREKRQDIDYYDFLKLTVYTHEIMPKEINNTWKRAFEVIPEVIIKILRSFITKADNAPIIVQSIAEIIGLLNEAFDNEIIREMYFQIEDKKDYKVVNDYLKDLWM